MRLRVPFRAVCRRLRERDAGDVCVVQYNIWRVRARVDAAWFLMCGFVLFMFFICWW